MEKILIIEDDSDIREIERDYLKKEDYTVIESENGLDGLKQFKLHNPNLVILDLNLPEKDGVEVCKEIRKISGVPIIMVTARTKEIDELIGLDSGADDYLKKPFSPKILISRVKALLKRPERIEGNTNIISFREIELDVEKMILKKNGQKIDITTVQFNILEILMRSPGKAFQRYELIDKSYNTTDSPDIFDRTMDSHIKNIRKLIEEDSRKPKYILTIRGIGYKFNDEI